VTPPTAATRLLALLGDPVGHSLSPRFQNAALTALGLDAVYVALRCDAAALAGLLRGIALAGGGGNVTVPHKPAAAAALDRPLPAVARTGACNTFWGEGGVVCGDNTDVAGVEAALRDLLGSPPGGASALLVGAGGAAAAAACALLDAGVARLTVLNRTPSRTEALAARLGAHGARIVCVGGAGALAGERFDVAVNATPLGLGAADPLPLPPEGGPAIAAALDLVYAPGGTAWVRVLTARGIPAADGTGVLLHQGAAAFRRWWGVDPPLETMAAALREAAA
jgi:shikimate dehydrogenase